MSGKIACERSLEDPLKGHSIQQTTVYEPGYAKMSIIYKNAPGFTEYTKTQSRCVFLKYQDVQQVQYVLHTSLTCTENFSSQKLPTSIGSSKKLLMKNNIAKVQEINWYILVCERGPERPFYRFLQIQSSSNVHHFIIS